MYRGGPAVDMAASIVANCDGGEKPAIGVPWSTVLSKKSHNSSTVICGFVPVVRYVHVSLKGTSETEQCTLKASIIVVAKGAKTWSCSLVSIAAVWFDEGMSVVVCTSPTF